MKEMISSKYVEDGDEPWKLELLEIGNKRLKVDHPQNDI
jgi:hypothetical protein